MTSNISRGFYANGIDVVNDNVGDNAGHCVSGCDLSLILQSLSSKLPAKTRGPHVSHPVWNYFYRDIIRKICICQVVSGNKPCGTVIKGLKDMGQILTSTVLFDLYLRMKEGGYVSGLSSIIAMASNCGSHIAKKHPEISLTKLQTTSTANYSEPTLKRQTLESKLDNNSDFYERKSLRYRSITEALVYYIATNGTRKATVTDIGFRTLLRRLDPHYLPPSQQLLTKYVNKYVRRVRKNLQESLASSTRTVIVVNILSGPGFIQSCLAISACFFDKNLMENRRALFAVRHFASPHSADMIKHHVDAVLQEWQIGDKVFRYLTDNGRNIVKASSVISEFPMILSPRNMDDRTSDISDSDDNDIDEDGFFDEDDSPVLGSKNNVTRSVHNFDESDVADFDDNDEQIQKEITNINQELEEFQSFRRSVADVMTDRRHLRCFVHSLMSVIGKGADCQPEFATFRRLVFKLAEEIISITASDERDKAVKDLKLKTVSARHWSNLFVVLDHLLKFKETVDTIAKRQQLLFPSWSMTEEAREFLAPFAEATTRMQTTNQSTVAIVLPTLVALQRHLGKVHTPSLGTVVAGVRQALSEEFVYVLDVESSEFDPIYCAATYLHPFWTLCLTEQQVNASRQFITKLIRQSRGNCINRVADDPLSPVTTDQSHQDPTTSASFAGCDGLFASVYEDIKRRRLELCTAAQKPSAATALRKQIERELNEYNEQRLQIAELISNSDGDIMLRFWLDKQTSMPLLFDVAVDLATIPASSVLLEDVLLQQAATIFNDNDYRLNVSRLETELFLRMNAKLDQNNDEPSFL